MGNLVGKASACLREAASAKAGANRLIEKHGRSCPLLEFTFRVRSTLSHKISNRPPSGALPSCGRVCLGEDPIPISDSAVCNEVFLALQE